MKHRLYHKLATKPHFQQLFGKNVLHVADYTTSGFILQPVDNLTDLIELLRKPWSDDNLKWCHLRQRNP